MMTNTKTFSLFASLVAVALLVPALAFAGPIIRSGDSVAVEADQVLEGDFYGAGSTVSISGTAEHDVYVMGGSVTVNGPVNADLVIAGGTVQVHGTVKDDVRVAGGEVVIAERVEGDVVLFGGTLTILSSGSVGGDVLFAGGEMDISGEVTGSIIGIAENVRLDSSIGGNVSVTAARSLSLGDRTEIQGNLEYRSNNELARAQGAVVVGDIQEKPPLEQADTTYGSLLSLLVLLFAALSGYLLFRGTLQRLVEKTVTSYGVQGLVGLAVVLGVPFVAFILIASVLGSIVGIALLLLYVLLLIASWIAMGIVLGAIVLKPITKNYNLSLISVIVGVIAVSLISIIPFIGVLLVIALYLITLGGISIRVYETFR